MASKPIICPSKSTPSQARLGKVGQNRLPHDRHGMLRGLLEANTPETLAVAAEVRKTLEGT